MTLRQLIVLCCLLNCGNAAAAIADTGTDDAIVIDKYLQHIVVNPDGSYTLTVDMAATIMAQRAVQGASQRAVGYNATSDEIVSMEAHTVKPGGRIVNVTADQIKDQQEAASTEAPMFHDTRKKVVVYPDVEVGDKLALRYVLKRKTALFPGHFEDISASEFVVNKRFDLIYDMPNSMPLYADAVGFNAIPIDSPAGRKRYHWRYVDGPNQRMEADSVHYFDYGKRLAVSTFADYRAFALSYHARAADKALVTPPIAELARTLTAGLENDRAKAYALYDWVRDSIRYVAVYVGDGGVVPHPASTVLANRYGDCKDHTVLLEAMLSAVGIDSTPALINGGDAYRLPSAPSLGIFNHVINYIPGLDLYLDSTASDIAAGYLPSAELGKPVLLTKTGMLARTPSTQSVRHHNVARYKVQADGTMSMALSKRTGGAIAEQFRRSVRDTGPADRDMAVERMFKNMGQIGSGSMEPGNVHGKGDDYVMGFNGNSENFIYLPGPTGVSTTFSFWGGLGDAVFGMSGEKQRTQDFTCIGYEFGDEARFEFAEGIDILALPQPFQLKDDYFTYDAAYIREGNSVQVRRNLKFHHHSAVCTPKDFRRMHPSIQRIIRDLNGQIIVRGA